MRYIVHLVFLSWLFLLCIFCFFHDTATTEIYTYLHTLSLHDALPISALRRHPGTVVGIRSPIRTLERTGAKTGDRRARTPYSLLPRRKRHPRARSEEHTSELQSLMRISYAVFCLKKKTTIKIQIHLTSK